MKKILALVLALAMALSVGAFAGFSDVPDTDANLGTYELLAGLKIIDGYADGTFGANKAVTRAEAAAFIYRLATGESKADYLKGVVVYNGKPVTDCDKDAWYTGYINWAIDNGIMAGYPDGTFKPEATVSVAEMSKMLVVALGYPANNYTFPYGFMTQAKNLGVLKNVDAVGPDMPCLRSMISNMVSNSLLAKRMAFITINGSTVIDQNVKTFLEAVFGAKSTIADVVVGGTSQLAATGIAPAAANKVLLTGAGVNGSSLVATYTGDASALIGRKVVVLFKDKVGTDNVVTGDDTIYAITPIATEKIVYAPVAGVAFASAADVAADASLTANHYYVKVDGVRYDLGVAADTYTILEGYQATQSTKTVALSTLVAGGSSAVVRLVANTATNAVTGKYASIAVVNKITDIDKDGKVSFAAVGQEKVVGTNATTAVTGIAPANVKGYAGMAKGDIVYATTALAVNKAANGAVTVDTIYNVAKANLVSNVSVTGANPANTEFTIGTAKYKLAEGATAPSLKTTGNLVLSPTGYFIAMVDAKNTDSSFYAVATNVGSTTDNSNWTTVYKDHTITLALADGTSKTYPVKTTSISTTFIAAADKKWVLSTALTPIVLFQPLKVTINSAGEVIAIAEETTAGLTTNLVVKGQAATGSAGGISTLGADSAVFYINGHKASSIGYSPAELKAMKVTAYKGASIPETTASALIASVVDTNAAKSLKVAFVSAPLTTVATSDNRGYIQYMGSSVSGDKTLYNYKATFKGEIVNLVTEKEDLTYTDDKNASTAKLNTLVVPTYGQMTSDGVAITGFTQHDGTAAIAAPANDTVAGVSGNLLILTTLNSNIYSVNDKTKVYTLTAKTPAAAQAAEGIGAKATIADVKVGSFVKVVANSNNVITELYILTK